MAPVLSVIIPAYRAESYLPRCLKSVWKLPVDLVEIIVIDDGSPDDSGMMADGASLQKENLTVIHRPNGGLSAARNCGMLMAKGRYVFFLDADDFIDEKTFLHACSLADAMPSVDIFFFDVYKHEGEHAPSIMRKRILPANVICTGEASLKSELSFGKYNAMAQTGFYRKSFLLRNGLLFRQGILHEDEQWSPRVALAARRVIKGNDVFYHYMIHDNSITQRKDKRDNAKDLICTCCELAQLYAGLQDAELKKRLECYNAKLYMHSCSVEFRLGIRSSIDRRMVFGKWRSLKDFLRMLLFTVCPRLYATWIDAAFIK